MSMSSQALYFARINSAMPVRLRGPDVSLLKQSISFAVTIPARFGAAARPKLYGHCKRTRQYVPHKPLLRHNTRALALKEISDARLENFEGPLMVSMTSEYSRRLVLS